MLAFFKCVASAIVEKGLPGLAEMIPGGKFAYDVAEAAWKKYREQKKDADARDEVQQLAAATFEEARQAAVEAVREVLQGEVGVSDLDKLTLELYLTQIPSTVRRTLKRAEDPTGKTVPVTFSLKSPNDFGDLLPAKPPRFAPGQPLVGKSGWVLTELLGVGGFGEVWLARHSRMTSLSGAVKFCHGEAARDLQHESTLIDRVLAAGKHPNIVPLLDVNLDSDSPWVMFEYVQGGDLSDLIRELQGLPQEQRLERALRATEQLADAVGHFHRLTPAVVHRDLKPSNILCDRVTGALRITDFGIGAIAARATLGDETGTRGRLLSYLRGSHTPLYASPQQRAGADPDPRDDVHALGVIIYQMLTGDLNSGVGTDFGDDLRDAGATEAMVALVGACVAQKPERRPATGGELRERLHQIAEVRRIGASGSRPSKPVAVATAPRSNRQGVIATILRELEAATAERPATKAAIHEVLKREFPDRDPEGMLSTIQTQLGSRLRSDRKLAVVSRPTDAGTGFWIDAVATAALQAGETPASEADSFRVWLVRMLEGQGRYEAAEVVERLLEWADSNGYQESGKSTASQGGSLRFAIQHRGRLYEVFSFGGKGEIQLPFQYMSAGPFVSESRRREYRDRVGRIPRVAEQGERWDSLTGWPSFPLELIHNTDAFKQFQEAVNWATSTIRAE